MLEALTLYALLSASHMHADVALTLQKFWWHAFHTHFVMTVQRDRLNVKKNYESIIIRS